jgi:hypothetical protein
MSGEISFWISKNVNHTRHFEHSARVVLFNLDVMSGEISSGYLKTSITLSRHFEHSSSIIRSTPKVMSGEISCWYLKTSMSLLGLTFVFHSMRFLHATHS